MSCLHCHCARPADASRKGWRHGYCNACYKRWQYRGYPAGGPPPAGCAQRVSGPAAGRLEDYAELRSWGLSQRQAAVRMGVTLRTAQRYEAAIRQQEVQAA